MDNKGWNGQKTSFPETTPNSEHLFLPLRPLKVSICQLHEWCWNLAHSQTTERERLTRKFAPLPPQVRKDCSTCLQTCTRRWRPAGARRGPGPRGGTCPRGPFTAAAAARQRSLGSCCWTARPPQPRPWGWRAGPLCSPAPPYSPPSNSTTWPECRGSRWGTGVSLHWGQGSGLSSFVCLFCARLRCVIQSVHPPEKGTGRPEPFHQLYSECSCRRTCVCVSYCKCSNPPEGGYLRPLTSWPEHQYSLKIYFCLWLWLQLWRWTLSLKLVFCMSNQAMSGGSTYLCFNFISVIASALLFFLSLLYLFLPVFASPTAPRAFELLTCFKRS